MSSLLSLLSILGLELLVVGVAQQVQVSAAVGAFLVGTTLSGTIAKRAHRLLAPLRNPFAAVFFLFFGLQIDPATLGPVMLPAPGLGIVTALVAWRERFQMWLHQPPDRATGR